MTNDDSKIVLASQSPRRVELLKEISAQFEVAPSSIEEVLDPGLRPEENAQNLARAKAESIASNFPDCWVIGADTLVTLDHEIFGKPEDEEDAKRILKKLSGREHLVVTGICVVGPKKTLDKAVVSKVKIKPLTDQEIEDYISTGEPMDKAGAYAIQGEGNFMVRSFSGSKNNIIGLPLDELKILLKKTYHPTYRGSYGSKSF
ncbi:MAG TPA: septum formation protein Maf [Nitrospinae bacterium]|jgi:septum formation protein|nr:septum formation protein Maf [Nitrospinota bacterium]